MVGPGEIDAHAFGWLNCWWYARGVPLTLVNVRADEGGADPELYGPDVRRGFCYALVEGWAVLTPAGRMLATDLGRREWESERLESYT